MHVNITYEVATQHLLKFELLVFHNTDTLYLLNPASPHDACSFRRSCPSPGGLDIAEQSRDVFNDVSKYIHNISISLTAVFP